MKSSEKLEYGVENWEEVVSRQGRRRDWKGSRLLQKDVFGTVCFEIFQREGINPGGYMVGRGRFAEHKIT